jgi:chaperone BCS1
MFMSMFAPDLLSWARQSASCSEIPHSDAKPDAVMDPLDEHVSMEQLRMLAAQFAAEVPEDTFTPSQLQGFFQLHLGDVMQAVASIGDWVRQETSAKGERRFEMC